MRVFVRRGIHVGAKKAGYGALADAVAFRQLKTIGWLRHLLFNVGKRAS